MTKLDTVIMPTTIADDVVIRQLLLFSDSVSQFVPAEDSINPEMKSIYGNLYKQYAPVPFGEKLDTFQKFIKDLTRYRAEYYSGALSQLSTGLSSDIEESSVWRLIHKLAKETSVEEKQAEALMHAKLFLKLAEIHHIEEDEINSALQSVDSDVGQILAELKDEENMQVNNVLATESKLSKASSEQLLSSWCHLFLADTTDSNFSVIATDKDTYTTLNEHASSLLSPPENMLGEISLPSKWLIEKTDNFSVYKENIIKTKKEEIQQLKNHLLLTAKTAPKGRTKTKEFSVILADNPDSGNAPLSLIRFYSLPLTLPELACKITKASVLQKAHNYTPNTIAAVVTP